MVPDNDQIFISHILEVCELTSGWWKSKTLLILKKNSLHSKDIQIYAN